MSDLETRIKQSTAIACIAVDVTSVLFDARFAAIYKPIEHSDMVQYSDRIMLLLDKLRDHAGMILNGTRNN